MTDLPNPESADSLFNFPCDFPIKIIGLTREGFAQTILAVVLQYAPDFKASSMEMRPSSKGKYLSLTCVIRAVSRAQLDDLYRALSGHEMVIHVF